MFKRVFIASTLFCTLLSPHAQAEDIWGCEVLLCLSNPNGPTAVNECIPPITRLYKAIFKWKPDPFPKCTLKDGNDSSTTGNYANVGSASYYDACPAGTTAAGDGNYVVAGTPVPKKGFSSPGYKATSGVFRGIGDGSGFAPDSEGTPMPAKVCVGKKVASATHTIKYSFDDVSKFPLGVYDKVVVISPASDTFNINVVINGGLFRNIRPFSQSASTVYTN